MVFNVNTIKKNKNKIIMIIITIMLMSCASEKDASHTEMA